MRPVFLLALIGCGRVGFAPQQDAAVDGPGDMQTMNVIGCADGTREGFADTTAFPTIAACTAAWGDTRDMRAAPTGAPCGDGLGACEQPADACAVGWHVCARNGDPMDLASRITSAECATAGNALGGLFVGASSHCTGCNNGCMVGADCVYSAVMTCEALTAAACTEPVCCGPDCDTSNTCQFGVFPEGIHIGPIYQPCGALPSANLTGVLCCR